MNRTVRNRSWAAFCTAVFACTSAFGFIDPKFTPVDLVKQSDVIFVATYEMTKGADMWRPVRTGALKGPKPEPFHLNVGSCKEADLANARDAVLSGQGQPAVVFAAKTPDAMKGYLHISGRWLAVRRNEAGTWDVESLAMRLSGTWAGGTDMLIEATRHLLAEPDADVPVSVGVAWMQDRSDLGKVPGNIGRMEAVRPTADGPVHLFVASDAGDRLYRTKPNDEAFEDVTRATRLATRSRRFAWTDLDGDGRVDLVSWDGKAISLWRISAAGTFERGDGGKGFALADCLGLAPCAMHTDGTPALLVTTTEFPLLLRRVAGNWVKTELPRPMLADWGGTSCPCIVADFDGDGWWDVLQPAWWQTFLWKGSAKGLADPVVASVKVQGKTCRFTLGDFNQDGALDVFLSDEKVSALWENDGTGNFRDVTASGGSLSYRLPAGASDCLATDLNHDGRPDLCVLYRNADFAYHFNRGFRCFGEEGELRLFEPEGNVPARAGQTACAVADFNSDGSLDLAVVFADGTVCVYYNQAFNRPFLRVRLADGTPAPVTAGVWSSGKTPVSLGALPVYAPPAHTVFTLPGPGTFTLRWKPPGKPEHSTTVTVPDEIPETGFDVILGKP